MIRHVFQPSRGGCKARLWSGRVRLDDWPKAKTYPLRVTDKRVAEQKLAQIVQELELSAAGLGVPVGVRNALKKPLSEHVAAFLADVKSRRAPRTVKLYRTMLRTLANGCGWTRLQDITPGSITNWPGRSKLSPSYFNDLLSCARCFLAWMERNGAVERDPLRFVQKIANAESGEYRRALSVVEVGMLLTAAPPKRARVYLVILYTGLRRHEMNALRWADLDLDGSCPRVHLAATITKNRKAATLYLRPEVVAAIREIRSPTAGAKDWAFRRRVPAPSTLRKDLTAAGVSPMDERGRRVDVHALRTTFGTLLSASGVPPRVAMELMRHSDLRLTMRVYTDVAQLPLASELNRLPAFYVPGTKECTAPPRKDGHLIALADLPADEALATNVG